MTSAALATLPALHDSGEGPALLLLHAFPLDASQWDHQVAALSGSFRCLRPDLWGCGASPPPPAEPPSVDAYARAVLQLLDARGIGRVTVAGSSMGGYVAFALLRIAPERVSALILASTRAAADSDEHRAQRERDADAMERTRDLRGLSERSLGTLLAPGNAGEAHMADPVRGRILRCAPEGVAYALRAMAARPDSTGLVSALRMPVLILTGAEDVVISPDETAALAAATPDGATLVELPGCGHLPNLEDPAAFTTALTRFLDRRGA